MGRPNKFLKYNSSKHRNMHTQKSDILIQETLQCANISKSRIRKKYPEIKLSLSLFGKRY